MKKLSILIILAILAVLTACDKNNNTNDPATNPVFSVKLVDATSGYDAVNVEVLYMEANMGNGWVEFPVEQPGVYNLQEFTNGNTMLLIGDTSITPGMMSELRLILGTNNTVVVDGISYELETPSGQTSGYKIKMDPQPLELGGLYRLIIDFDVSVSVHMTGNGKYMLKPVVRGYLETAVGAIAGTISPPAGAYYIEALNYTDTTGTLIDPVTGEFLIGTAMPGTYNVTFYANPGFSDRTIGGVVVLAGNITQMGIVNIE
ncbi:MAG: DUF4382 domain-containing protein [Bacteroidales bacterium]|nr:DUF4382 domain-containing protein [Bacteroidales bacterium]